MDQRERNTTSIVTGAFGYIGRYIAAELLSRGKSVRTITTHPEKPNPFGDQVEAFPYNFDNPEALTETLKGCDVLFNTYWVRFDYKSWSFAQALENTRILFDCAKQAGIRKIVQISVTNCSEDDTLPYYRGKAQQERMLKELGIPYSIIRPTLVFGKEDILVNNIAWTIRKFPIVPVFGSGDYRIMPIFVEDLARLAVDSAERDSSEIFDAIGPETFTYRELLETISDALDRNVRFVKMPPWLGLSLGRIIGLIVRDVLLTKDELHGLMASKLTSTQAPKASTKFSEWVKNNAYELGASYTSELKRHFHWKR